MAKKGENVVGTSVELTGEEQYRQSLDRINKTLSTSRSEQTMLAEQYKRNSDSTEALTAKQDLLSRQYDQQRQKVELMKKHLAEVADAKGKDASETIKLQNALNRATADMYKTENALLDVGEALEKNAMAADEAGGGMQELGENAGKMGDETDKGAEKAASSGGKLQKLGQIAAGVAKAFAAAVATIAAGAAAGAAAAGKLVSSFADNAGAIDDSAKKVGMGAEEYQKWAYAAKLGGMEMATLEGVMVKQQKSFSDAVEGSKTASAAYQRLGIDIKQVGSSSEAFDLVIKRLADMEDTTERNALANDLFGKSYAELAPMLAEGSAGIEALKQEAAALGGVMSEEAVAAGAEFGDTMDRIKFTAGGLASTLGAMLLPAAKGVAGGMQEVLTGVNAALKDGFQPEDVRTVGELISSKLMEGLRSISKHIPAFVKVVSASLSEAMGIIVGMLPELLPALADGALQLMTGVISAITENVQPLVDAAVAVVGKFGEFLVTALPQLIVAAAQIMTALMMGISEQLPTLIPAAVNAILTIVQGLIDNLPMLIEAAIQIMMGLATGIIDSLPVLIQRIPEIIQNIVTTLVDNLPLLIEASIEIIIALAEGLITNIPMLVEQLPKIIEAIVNGVLSLISKIWEIGKNIVEGIWKGIQDAAAWFADKVKSFFTGIVDGVKKVLGIKSPSTVFAEIGSFMAAGLGVGFTREAGNVNKQIGDTIAQMGGTANLQVNASYSKDPLTAPLAHADEVLEQYTVLGVSMSENVLSGFTSGADAMTSGILALIFGSVETLESEGVPAFDDLGGAFAEAIGAGFADAWQSVEQQLMDAADRTLAVLKDKISKGLAAIEAASNRTATGGTSSGGSSGSSSGGSPSGGSGGSGGKSTTITQYVTVNSAKQMSPSEVARANANYMRQAAMGIL